MRVSGMMCDNWNVKHLTQQKQKARHAFFAILAKPVCVSRDDPELMAARGLWGAILLCSSLPMMVRGGPIRATKDHSSPVRPINDHTVPLVHLRSAAHVKQDQIGPEMATSDHSVPQQDKLGTSKVEEITLYASQNLRNQHDEVADRQCVNDSQCFPSAVLSIPRALVYCDGDTKTCVCNNCFVLINNTCAVERCHRYDNDSGRCQDERKSQKDSLLISVFLSATGAANLYIGQEALGEIERVLVCMREREQLGL